MTRTIDRAFLSHPSHELTQFLWEFIALRKNDPSTPPWAEELIAILGSEADDTFAKSTAAFLAGLLRLESAIPLLVNALGEVWIDPQARNVRLRCSPEDALLMIGPAIRPAIEGFLQATDRADLITLATIMVFNITRSKEEARKSLAAAMAARKAEDRLLFEDALNGLDTWKG